LGLPGGITGVHGDLNEGKAKKPTRGGQKPFKVTWAGGDVGCVRWKRCPTKRPDTGRANMMSRRCGRMGGEKKGKKNLHNRGGGGRRSH